MRRFIVMFAAAALAMVGLPGSALAQPSNDDFDAATVVTEPLPFSDSISTTEATPAEDDPSCAGIGATVWYHYTPSVDSVVNANTFGSDYDTTLSVYTGERGALSQVACNDDSGSLQSSATWEAVAGTTYHLMVGSFNGGPGGNLSFTVQEGQLPPPPPPPIDVQLIIDAVGSVDPRTGLATVSGTVTCSEPSSMSVYGELRQRAGRQVISGNFWDSRFCDGETPWSATVENSNGIFVGGPAQVSADAYACDYYSCGFDQATADIRLRSAGS